MSNEVIISKEDFINWKNDSITKAVFTLLEQCRDEYVEDMMRVDAYLNDSDKDRGKRVGLIEGLNMLLGLDFEDEEEEELNVH
jgi:hypothetical protein